MTTLPAQSILVTAAALRIYASARRLQPEEASRELTELLCGAKQIREAARGLPAQYRHRSRRTGLDITAHVSHEGPLAIVVDVTVRTA